MGFASLAAIANQPGALQSGKMLGNHRLRHTRALGQSVHGLFAIPGQPLEDGAASGIGESAEKFVRGSRHFKTITVWLSIVKPETDSHPVFKTWSFPPPARHPAPSTSRSATLIPEAHVSHFISFVRIPALAIRQRLRPLPRIGLLHEDALALRVWPNDIDFNFHMNNACYLSAMDYGRMHLLARVGLLEPILRSRWQPLVGAVWVTYRRSLPAFARFTLTSRLVCWDERWFYIEQIFTSPNIEGPVAIGWVKGALRGPEGTLNPQQIIDGIAPGLPSPPIPDTIAAWNELTREKLQNS